MDWWESKQLEENLPAGRQGISLTAAPARHFSGRGIRRGQTFWSSFILRTNTHNIYIGGDSGYDTHFADIGNKSGPFDVAILESGQYNKMWPLIHMMPEEMVQAAIDLKAKKIIPVHWGKFRLGMHPWNEPVKLVVEKAKQLNMQLITPQIGESINLNSGFQGNAWWEI